MLRGCLIGFSLRYSTVDLQQRSYYLAQALASAKSAGNLDADDVDFVNTIQESMDVSNVQLEVARAIETHVDLSQDEKADILGKLNSSLLGLDEVCRVVSWGSPRAHAVSCSKTLHDLIDCLNKSC